MIIHNVGVLKNVTNAYNIQLLLLNDNVAVKSTCVCPLCFPQYTLNRVVTPGLSLKILVYNLYKSLKFDYPDHIHPALFDYCLGGTRELSNTQYPYLTLRCHIFMLAESGLFQLSVEIKQCIRDHGSVLHVEMGVI